MEKSQSIKELATALKRFQAVVKPVVKKGDNPFFRSKYAKLDDIIEQIIPVLTATNLSFSQFPTGKNCLTTILMHDSGEFLQATFEMVPKDESPQALGSCITYARRYALASILGLATEEDDDGNTASSPKTAPRKEITPPKVISNKYSPNAPYTSVSEVIDGMMVPKIEVHGADEITPPKKPKLSPRSKIMHLCKLLDIDPIFAEDEVMKLTKLPFVETHFDEIITRLEIVVKEKNEFKK